MIPEGKRILVACIGNVFHGDDGFGVAVAGVLAERTLPDEVQVTDFGIRSYDLAFAMLDGYEAVILVDAASRGKPPGAVFVLDAAVDGAPGPMLVSGHSMSPHAVLGLVETMGGYEGPVFVVGCEPAVLEPAGVGLSAPVQAAVDEAADLVECLTARLLNGKIPVATGT